MGNKKYLMKLYNLGKIIIPKVFRQFFNIENSIGMAITSDSIMLSPEYSEKINVDKLGGITIPDDIANTLNFIPDTKLEILFEDNYIVIKKPHICKIRKFNEEND